jgi:hypothetical protein
MSHRIIVAPVRKSNGAPKCSQRGPLFAARFEGETVVVESTQPLLDACRVLKARGLSGPVEMWSEGGTWARLRSTVEVAARLTVREGEGRPRFAKWKPHPGAGMPGNARPDAKDGQNDFAQELIALGQRAAVFSEGRHE